MESQQRLTTMQEEVGMVEPEVVQGIEALKRAGFGVKRISRELGLARNTVRRYVRLDPPPKTSERPHARRLGAAERERAIALFDGPAAGNAIVVAGMLAEEGLHASVRTVQRALAGHRQQLSARAIATVRFETAPGQQMQVDFGQKKLTLGGREVVVFLLVAMLAYSRRLFVQAFLNERRESWFEGIANAFRRFGGVPRKLLGDNPRALVVGRDRETQTVTFDPAYLTFCRDWGVVPRACAPYRARTKGKVESAVKYVKRNALAGRSFCDFAALEQHLSTWLETADRREHGTTRERPIDRFERERDALLPLPEKRFPQTRRLRRKVAADARIDLDTVRYSVPFRLVREDVEVLVTESEVLVFHGSVEVARHPRSKEPHADVVDSGHFAGLWRRPSPEPRPAVEAGLQSVGLRSLSTYAAIVEEAGR